MIAMVVNSLMRTCAVCIVRDRDQIGCAEPSIAAGSKLWIGQEHVEANSK
jgi:hypothetical protein